MNNWRALYHLVLADYLERVRGYGFLFVLGLTVLAAYVFVPPQGARYGTGFLFCLMSPVEGGCLMYARGEHNSAWVGITVAYLVMTLLSLPGFYLVKNSIERDRRSRVGEIIAATPLSKLLYVLGKWISNLAILGAIVALLAICSLLMQLWRGEDMYVNLWKLWSPFLIMTLPTMSIVAALAVLFETIPWLQGGVGNVAYFFLWITMLATNIGQDLLGSSLFPIITKDFEAAFPDYRVSWNAGINPVKKELLLLSWEGIEWTSTILLERLVWIGVALGIVLLAALFFQRFDPPRSHFQRTDLKKVWYAFLRELSGRSFRRKSIQSHAPVNGLSQYYTGIDLRPVEHAPKLIQFVRILWAELRLMLKGQRWWWYVIGLGLLAFSWSMQTTDIMPREASPVVGIWPILIWSGMGVRERLYRTEELVFSSAYSIRRQLPVVWIAGLIVAVVTWSGIAVHSFVVKDWMGILAWGSGILFIPSLSLALGIWSGSSKLFEVTYTFLWYAGPMNGMPTLDFVGASGRATSVVIPLVYLCCSAVLCCLAIFGRRRQIGDI
jgi:hypothetical protein